MSLVVSLVGRPNVGKSSLFNCFMPQEKRSLVLDKSGVTRDRHYGFTQLNEGTDLPEQEIILVDTGGFYPQEDKKLSAKEQHFFKSLVDQAKLAIEESDLVLLVLDARASLLPLDQEIYQLIKTQNKKVWVVVNKYDSDKQWEEQTAFYALGIKESELFFTSAAHARGISDLKVRLQQESAQSAQSSESHLKADYPVIGSAAILGAPNAGKSTFLNYLTQSERALVSPYAGTTIDPTEAYFNFALTPEEKRSVQLIDTAGIRRKSKIADKLESLSVFKALRSIDRADLVFYLVDATQGIGHQDRRLIEIAWEKGKSIFLCLNKMDLLAEKVKTPKLRQEFLQDMRINFPWRGCEIFLFSALNGQFSRKLFTSLKHYFTFQEEGLKTSELNECLSGLLKKNPLNLHEGRLTELKIKYASMIKKTPPTFLLFTNRRYNIPEAYRRYLQNGLREHFQLYNQPIHLLFRTQTDKN